MEAMGGRSRRSATGLGMIAVGGVVALPLTFAPGCGVGVRPWRVNAASMAEVSQGAAPGGYSPGAASGATVRQNLDYKDVTIMNAVG
jgi:hypothetical protein